MSESEKTGVVFGGAGGIGTSICARLIQCGLRVFSVDLRKSETEGVSSVECDVREPSSVSAAISTVREASGRIDVLVYCAGVTRDAVTWKLPVEDWDLVHTINLRGAFLAIRAVIPVMREVGGGRIVLIGSINGSRGKFGTAAYSASKAGLLGMAKSTSRETGRFGITVNVVEPGMVRTPLTRSLPGEVLEDAALETLLGELVEPDDVAEVVAMLCGPAGRRITGQVIRVDAGQFLGG